MSDKEQDFSVVELQARWDKIRVANLYDTLDKMGYGNQCLDLGIRPLFTHQHLAGKALTCAGGRDPRTREQIEEEQKAASAPPRMHEILYPGCVLVVDSGGEQWTGKFGEMTSWSLKQGGAKGIVIDGFIRDSWGLEAIPGYTVCARGTSPIESAGRWRIHSNNISTALPGTLTSQVAVRPGDWIVGEADGVIVVPQEIAMEALIKVEEIEHKEQGMREDLAAGMSFRDAYEKWGRA